jgi:hypothetical protein
MFGAHLINKIGTFFTTFTQTRQEKLISLIQHMHMMFDYAWMMLMMLWLTFDHAQMFWVVTAVISHRYKEAPGAPCFFQGTGWVGLIYKGEVET